MKNWLEKQFRLSEFNTNIKTELLAGLTTFVTMAYVLATIPNILAGAGYDKHTTPAVQWHWLPIDRLLWLRDLEALELLRL